MRGEHDPHARTFTLVVAQTTPPTPGQPDKQPLHMPLALGLLDRAGQELPLQLEGEAAPAGTARVLELTEAEHRFTFTGVRDAAGALAAARLLGARSSSRATPTTPTDACSWRTTPTRSCAGRRARAMR